MNQSYKDGAGFEIFEHVLYNTFNSSLRDVRSGCSSAASTALSNSAIFDSADVSQVNAEIMFSWNCTRRVNCSCRLSFLSSQLEGKHTY